jgi:omega-hydroxy-beta-dihydromenaquinone-9 sulfotransferase
MTTVPTDKPGRRREWTPRIWEGCNSYAWLRLLVRNRFAVDRSHLYIAAVVTVVSFYQTLLRFVQGALYGPRLRRTPIADAPIFIVGHWRTGTTLLHELLILDERHNFPTTYECLAPNNFLLTERLVPRLFRFLMPSRRPMDNVAAGWDRPQEDEFALAMLGQPSPYLTIAFPNRPPQDPEALDLDGLSPRALASWKRAFLGFVREVTYRKPRRLVLKSPTHSCRIRHLLSLFPDARFVHIVRDPYVVFPSTVNLWKSLYATHGLQKPTFAGLEEHVLRTFTHLYARLEEGRRLVPEGRFHELKYEDLVRDPLGEMRTLYDRLGLGGFEGVRPRLEAYLAANADYKTNRYELAEEVRAKVEQHWGDVIRRYGYARETAGLGRGEEKKHSLAGAVG